MYSIIYECLFPSNVSIMAIPPINVMQSSIANPWKILAEYIPVGMLTMRGYGWLVNQNYYSYHEIEKPDWHFVPIFTCSILNYKIAFMSSKLLKLRQQV